MRQIQQYRYSNLHETKVLHGYHYHSLSTFKGNDVLSTCEGLYISINNNELIHDKIMFHNFDDLTQLSCNMYINPIGINEINQTFYL